MIPLGLKLARYDLKRSYRESLSLLWQRFNYCNESNRKLVKLTNLQKICRTNHLPHRVQWGSALLWKKYPVYRTCDAKKMAVPDMWWDEKERKWNHLPSGKCLCSEGGERPDQSCLEEEEWEDQRCVWERVKGSQGTVDWDICWRT